MSRRDAVLLRAFVKNVSPSRALLLSDDDFSEEEAARWRELCRERERGVCVAYLVGHKEFRYLDLFLTRDVLVPQPDTETLVEAAEQWIDTKSADARRGDDHERVTLLDLCTGSGAVALALATERRGLEAVASDISSAALAVARKNAKKYFPALRLIESDCYDAPELRAARFDLITANAPYIESGAISSLPAEVQSEPRLALDGGSDGLAIIRRIIAESPQHLTEGGALFLEAQSTQMKKNAALLQAAGFENIIVTRDLAGEERVIGGYLYKGP